MTRSTRILLTVLPLIAAAIAFWALALGPQRQEAADLESQVSDLQSQVAEQEQLALAAEDAREDFPRAYRRVVVLGKAAPEDDDTSSLLVQLNRIAGDSGVDFVSLETSEGSGAAPAPAPSAPQTPAETAEQSEQRVENVEGGEPATSPVPTEASAALLPIGASIGPAGLPVMKYSLSFEGDFFRLADFLEGLDELVTTRNDGSVGVRGRLVTVDGFDLTTGGTAGATGAAQQSASSALSANFNITTFLTPPEEGTTAGATPTGPAPVSEPQPASGTPPAEPTTTASTTTP